VSFASSRYAEAILVPKVPVATLLKDYKGNELRADALYKGKRLQIAGKAGEFKRDITNTIFMTVGTGAAFEHPEAQCFFDDAYASTVASLTKGETVTVVCTVAGLMMNVLMKDCAFAGAPVPYKAVEKKWEDMTPEEFCRASEDLSVAPGRGADDAEDRIVLDDLKAKGAFLDARLSARVRVPVPVCLSALRSFYPASESRGGGGGDSGGPSYESVLSSVDPRGADAGSPDLMEAQLSGPLRNAAFAPACGAPDDMKVTVRVAVKMGAAIGVTVLTQPASPAVATCIDHAVRGLRWPRSPDTDFVTTNY
jgi:hypothetical protein